MSAPADPLPPEVRAAADRGELVEAIKLLRAGTGLDLQAAKARVEAYRSGHAAAQPSGGQEQAVPDAVRQALQEGRKVDAIRLMREHGGLGLKEAHDWVEAQRLQRGAQPDIAPGEVPRGSGHSWWIIAVVLIAIGAWLLLRR